MTATGSARFTASSLLEHVDVASHGPDVEPGEPAQRAGFVLLPRAVLHAAGLSRDARLLYAVLLSYAWQQSCCFPSHQRLKADLGCGINQVTTYLRELEGAGLVTRRRRGLGHSTVYTLHDPTNRSGSQDDRAVQTHRNSESKITEMVKAESPKRRHEQDSGEYQAGEQHHPRASSPIDGAGHTDAVDDALLASLTGHGVTERIAVRLIKTHDTQAIREQLTWHPYRPEAKNPAGSLVQAIRERWPAPAAWLVAQAHAAAVAKQVEEEAVCQAEAAAHRREWEAKPLEERISGRLTFWLLGQQHKRRDPTPTEVEAKRAELLAELADEAGPASTIARLETSGNAPGASTIRELATVVNVPVRSAVDGRRHRSPELV